MRSWTTRRSPVAEPVSFRRPAVLRGSFPRASNDSAPLTLALKLELGVSLFEDSPPEATGPRASESESMRIQDRRSGMGPLDNAPERAAGHPGQGQRQARA